MSLFLLEIQNTTVNKSKEEKNQEEEIENKEEEEKMIKLANLFTKKLVYIFQQVNASFILPYGPFCSLVYESL